MGFKGEGFVLERGIILNLKCDFITHFETRHTLCHGFHGFYFSLRFSMVFMVSMISVWFPWFPYFLCGFHGFCGFHDCDNLESQVIASAPNQHSIFHDRQA